MSSTPPPPEYPPPEPDFTQVAALVDQPPFAAEPHPEWPEECCDTCALEGSSHESVSSGFVYQCLEGAPADDQNDLFVALFDHRENGGNNGVVDAATKYIESLGLRSFCCVLRKCVLRRSTRTLASTLEGKW